MEGGGGFEPRGYPATRGSSKKLLKEAIQGSSGGSGRARCKDWTWRLGEEESRDTEKVGRWWEA